MPGRATLLLLPFGVVLIGLLQTFWIEKQDWFQRAQQDERIGELPPGQVLTEFALGYMVGGFRGLLVNYLWVMADELKDERRFVELWPVLELITRLQPRNKAVWKFLAWNVGYNLPQHYSDDEDKWKIVELGLETYEEGILRLPKAHDLIFSYGMALSHKLPDNPYYLKRYRETHEGRSVYEDALKLFERATKVAREEGDSPQNYQGIYFSARLGLVFDGLNEGLPKERVLEEYRHALQHALAYIEEYGTPGIWPTRPLYLNELKGPIEWDLAVREKDYNGQSDQAVSEWHEVVFSLRKGYARLLLSDRFADKLAQVHLHNRILFLLDRITRQALLPQGGEQEAVPIGEVKLGDLRRLRRACAGVLALMTSERWRQTERGEHRGAFRWRRWVEELEELTETLEAEKLARSLHDWAWTADGLAALKRYSELLERGVFPGREPTETRVRMLFENLVAAALEASLTATGEARAGLLEELRAVSTSIASVSRLKKRDWEKRMQAVLLLEEALKCELRAASQRASGQQDWRAVLRRAWEIYTLLLEKWDTKVVPAREVIELRKNAMDEVFKPPSGR